MINNKLLEICKGEPNNLEQQYILNLFFFKAYKSKADTRTASGQKRKLKKKKMYVITLTVYNHANRNNFNLEENKETLEELRMSSFTELKSLGPLNRIENLAIFVLQ